MSHYPTLLERGDELIPVEVYFTAHPFRRGYAPRGEPQLEPDEPAFLEIEEVKTKDNQSLEVTSEETVVLYQIVEQYLNDRDSAENDSPYDD